MAQMLPNIIFQLLDIDTLGRLGVVNMLDPGLFDVAQFGSRQALRHGQRETTDIVVVGIQVELGCFHASFI